MPISELTAAEANLVKAAKTLDATRGPLADARAALAEAESHTSDARARLEAAQHREAVTMHAARNGEAIAAADLLAARQAVTEARAALEIAELGETPARDAFNAAARAFNTALAAHRHAEAVVSYWQKIDTAHQLDSLLAQAEGLAAQLRDPQGDGVFIHIRRTPVQVGSWGDIDLRAHHGSIEGMVRRSPLPKAA